MTQAVPRRDLVGKLVANRYLVGDVLGAGGLCTVYRGEDLRKQSDIAIKVLPADKAQGQGVRRALPARGHDRQAHRSPERRRHQRLGRAARRRPLPRDGAAQGHAPVERARGRGACRAARALVIARQMLVGLGRAHELGVVHRDVKPHNVMLESTCGGLETVKLFDFGIASNDRAAMKLTVPGTAFGTPEYIAPEQAKGEKVDARADLYGVGVVLFEMLCGRLPFVCKDDIAYLARAHQRAAAGAVERRARRASISRAVDALVLRALDKDPDKRFKDANEMIAAIDIARPATGRSKARGSRKLVWIARRARALGHRARLRRALLRRATAAPASPAVAASRVLRMVRLAAARRAGGRRCRRLRPGRAPWD